MNLARIQARLKRSLPGRLFLAALSGLYGLGVLVHRSLFFSGLLRRRELPVRTICIGNLTAGGTGKTPAVLLAVEELARKKLKPAILTRGYRRPVRGPKVLVMADGTEDVGWKVAGDEPWMLRQVLRNKGVPVLVAADRYASGSVALDRFPLDVLVLDDGFQHWGLKRDLDVVLLNAVDPFGGGRLLPLGTLREPARGLKRAGLVLLTHVDRVPKERLKEIRDDLERLAPGVPVAESIHKAEFLLDLRTKDRLPLTHLKDRKITAFSAIGDPESFEDQLRKLGAELTQIWRYPDHHPYSLAELRSLENARDGQAAVTTLKDLPRLPEGWARELEGEVFALAVKLKIVKGREEWEKCLFND